MKIWRWAVASLDRVNSRLKYVVALYILLVALWTAAYCYAGYKAYDSGVYGVAPDLFRSVGGNLVFFGLIGLAALVPSLGRPSDEPIDRRLSFLITSTTVTDEALAYIRAEIVRLCGYMEESKLELRIREFIPEKMAMRVDHRVRAVARNTFQSEVYVNPTFTVDVRPDAVPVDGPLGEIMLAEFVRDGVEQSLVDTPVFLDSVPFSRPAPLIISPNSTTTYRLHCWLWNDAKEDYCIQAHFYIASMVIELWNETLYPLSIVNVIGDGEAINLAPRERVQLCKAAIQPGQRSVFRVASAPAATA